MICISRLRKSGERQGRDSDTRSCQRIPRAPPLGHPPRVRSTYYAPGAALGFLKAGTTWRHGDESSSRARGHTLVPQCVIRAVIHIVDLMELDGRLLQLMERGDWSSLRGAPGEEGWAVGCEGRGPQAEASAPMEEHLGWSKCL